MDTFENVKQHHLEQRELAPGEAEQNIALKFMPGDEQAMTLACLWPHWTGNDEPDLLSFALITDEPPLEVAAAGHDRCPVLLKTGNLYRWLTTTASPSVDFDALLEDKERPNYAHKLAV